MKVNKIHEYTQKCVHRCVTTSICPYTKIGAGVCSSHKSNTGNTTTAEATWTLFAIPLFLSFF